MELTDRVHIAAHGLEVARLVEPLFEMRRADFYDLGSSLQVFTQAVKDHEGDEVYITISTGTNIAAIAGMMAAQTSDATPYYVRPTLAGGEDAEEGRYRLLESHVITPLTEGGYVRVEKAGRQKPVFLEERGVDALAAFPLDANAAEAVEENMDAGAASSSREKFSTLPARETTVSPRKGPYTSEDEWRPAPTLQRCHPEQRRVARLDGHVDGAGSRPRLAGPAVDHPVAIGGRRCGDLVDVSVYIDSCLAAIEQCDRSPTLGETLAPDLAVGLAAVRRPLQSEGVLVDSQQALVCHHRAAVGRERPDIGPEHERRAEQTPEPEMCARFGRRQRPLDGRWLVL